MAKQKVNRRRDRVMYGKLPVQLWRQNVSGCYWLPSKLYWWDAMTLSLSKLVIVLTLQFFCAGKHLKLNKRCSTNMWFVGYTGYYLILYQLILMYKCMQTTLWKQISDDTWRHNSGTGSSTGSCTGVLRSGFCMALYYMPVIPHQTAGHRGVPQVVWPNQK